jgi:hypothetical protein
MAAIGKFNPTLGAATRRIAAPVRHGRAMVARPTQANRLINDLLMEPSRRSFLSAAGARGRCEALSGSSGHSPTGQRLRKVTLADTKPATVTAGIPETHGNRLAARKRIVVRWEIRPAPLYVKMQMRASRLPSVTTDAQQRPLHHRIANTHTGTLVRQVKVPPNGAIFVLDEDKILFEIPPHSRPQRSHEPPPPRRCATLLSLTLSLPCGGTTNRERLPDSCAPSNASAITCGAERRQVHCHVIANKFEST